MIKMIGQLRIRFGTWAGARLRRAIALEFKNSAILRIGDTEIDLSELVKWDGERVCIDHEELNIRASQSADQQTGGKRYQQSRLKQRHRAELTKLRNSRLQEMAEQLKRTTPAMKKTDIAKALIASGEFDTMDSCHGSPNYSRPHKNEAEKIRLIAAITSHCYSTIFDLQLTRAFVSTSGPAMRASQ